MHSLVIISVPNHTSNTLINNCTHHATIFTHPVTIFRPTIINLMVIFFVGILFISITLIYFTNMLLCLKRNVYWIGMAKDTQSYCESCDACNRAKPPAPQPVPMINTPIGRPWEMLISYQGNSYLLVIQDYLTK